MLLRWRNAFATLALSLAGVLSLSACAAGPPSAAGSQPTSSPAASGQTPTDWAAILEAAKREGVVVCGCTPRPDLTRFIKDGFEAAHPDIRLDASPAQLPEFWVRVDAEPSLY